MAQIISIHSFRGGTGKSNTTANIAALLAAEGRCVGVVDTDIQSPGIHVLFGLDEEAMVHSLNDYLWGKCEIQQAAHDVTPRLGAAIPGRVFLIPSSIKAGEITRVLREGYDVGLLNEGFQNLVEALQLDVLLIVNKVPLVFDMAEVKARVEETYQCEVAAVLPHSDELMALASAGIFALRYPDHPVTAEFKRIATTLTTESLLLPPDHI